jgi:hypothetical protein
VLNNVQAGDTVHLRVTRSAGYIHAMTAFHQAKAPLRASHAWMVLHAAMAPSAAGQLISDVFLMMLFFPVGYWAATAKWAAAPFGAIAILLTGTWLVGLAMLTVEELLVCLVASGAGYVSATAITASQRGSSASKLA